MKNWGGNGDEENYEEELKQFYRMTTQVEFKKSWLCDDCNRESDTLVDWPVGMYLESNEKKQLCVDCYLERRKNET